MKLTVVAAVSLMPNVEHAKAHRESIAEMIGEGEDDDGGLAPDIEGPSTGYLNLSLFRCPFGPLLLSD